MDFSEESIYALDFASNIAKINNAKIILIHVVDLPQYKTSKETGEVTEILSQEGEAYTVLLINRIKERLYDLCEEDRYQNIEMEEIITTGSFIKTLLKKVTELKVDTIIMGTSGSRGINEILVGSNSEKIVRYSPCPVITIREPMNSNIQNIVFASDFKNTTDNLVKQLCYLQKIFNARLHLVKINTPYNFNPSSKDMSDIEWFIDKYKIKKCTKTVYNDMTEEMGIKHFSFQIGADIIALGTKQHTGFSHLINESIAENVVNHSFIPVWTYKIE